MDNRAKHLELIQGVINRMGENSFHIKGWTLALIGIVGGASAFGQRLYSIVGIFIPLVAFWFLDSYYLQQERNYRALYDTVRTNEINADDFTMNTKGLSLKGDEGKRLIFRKCLFSKTEAGFYLPLIISILLVYAAITIY